MYITHKDWTNGKWNVYDKKNGKENFIEAFPTLKAAEDFCLVKNSVKNTVKKKGPKFFRLVNALKRGS